MIPFQISISKGWLHDFGGFSFPQSYYFDPYERRATDQRIDQYLLEAFTEFPVFNFESNLVQKDFVSPRLLRIGALQPNLILGHILGAAFVFPDDADADINCSPIKDIKNESELPPMDSLIHHPLVQLFNEQILSGLKDASLVTIPPFFWDTSGRATIHGIFTSGYKLVGEQIFLMFYDNPQLAHAILTWITEAYLVLINHFASLAHMPITSVHVGECSGCLINKDDFQEFARPYIEQFGAFWPLRVHSCGFSNHLLDILTDIGNLSSLDVGSNTSVAMIRKRLGPTFLIEVAPPVEILLKGSKEEGCIEWITRTIKENEGGPLEIKCHLEPGYSLDNIRIINNYINDQGV